MKQWIEIWHTQKRIGKIVGHSKLTFFWGHGECEWPLTEIILGLLKGFSFS